MNHSDDMIIVQDTDEILRVTSQTTGIGLISTDVMLRATFKSWAASSKDLSDTNQETAQTSSSDVEAMDMREWMCWALDFAWCLTILSPNIAHIVLWTAILLGVPTRKGGKLADWFQLAVWTLVLTFCPPVQAAQAGALKHPFGSESREAFIDLSAPQVGHKLPLWPIKAAEMRLCARVKRMRRSMARSPLRLQRHLLLRRPASLFK